MLEREGTVVLAAPRGERMDKIFERGAQDALFLRRGKEPAVIHPYELYLLAINFNYQHIDREGLKERFKGDFDKDILDCIASQRVRLIFLLNSTGGGATTELELREIMKYVRSTGGDIFTFGNKKVHSLAAEILVEPPSETRYVANRTEIMFHLPQFLGKTLEKPGDQEHLENVLLSSARPEMRDEMRKRLKHACAEKQARPDCAVHFTEEEADELGVAKNAKGNLEVEFMRASQTTRGRYSGTAIEEFFE